MITCNLMGGLGNQLFQIFTTISYAIQTETNYKFTNAVLLVGGIRHTYWDSFFSELKNKTTDAFPPLTMIKETSFEYNDINEDDIRGKHILLNGYFQSYKYFEKNYSMICKIIRLSIKKLNVLAKIDYTTDVLSHSISLHFRMGDYKTIQHIHPIMNVEYYKNALKHIETNKTCNKVLYFCEDDDINEVHAIIDELEIEFRHRFTFVRCDNKLEDWEQMLIMSLCGHNIIANSTFSWWGAYLNSHPDKIVCYPSLWFGTDLSHNTLDMFPLTWVEITTTTNVET